MFVNGGLPVLCHMNCVQEISDRFQHQMLMVEIRGFCSNKDRSQGNEIQVKLWSQVTRVKGNTVCINGPRIDH